MSPFKHISHPRYQWIAFIGLSFTYLFFAGFTLQLSDKSTIEKVRNDSLNTARIQANDLRSRLQKFLLVPIILKENPDVTNALKSEAGPLIVKLNKKLLSLSQQTDATYIFVIDNNGRTIASSNYKDPDSFVGRDYQFRPYFLRAMKDGQAQYYAKGQTTGRSGLFLAGRVSGPNGPIGVIVVKVEFNDVTTQWQSPITTSILVNQDGIILFANDESLTFKTVTDLSEEKQAEILEARQFGSTALTSSQLDLNSTPFPLNTKGQRSVMSMVYISELEWSLFHLNPLKTSLESSRYRAWLIVLLVGIFLISLLLLYRRRLQKEREKQALTELLQSEVTRQTKELSETNNKLEHEITQREQVNIRFRAAREELAQANRLGSIGAITASVAHELNQPVSAIRTFAENGVKFLDRGNTDQATTNLESIVSLTERIGSISTELRRYARRGSDKIKPTELQDVFDGVTLLIGEKIRQKGIKLTIEGEPENAPNVSAGRVRLEQVFVNLIQNAIDALEGHEDPKINISITHAAPFIYIYVSDNGTGIDDSSAAQIFTPFITSKKHGVGIGLGIAKDIITEFGGTIKLAPSALGGATFLIKLRSYE